MADFKFDFEAVKGLDYDEAFETLFRQMEDHYNANFRSPKLVFGGAKKAASAKKGDKPKPRPANVDTDTVTAETVQLKDFQIRPSAAGDRMMIVGFAKDNSPINDLLLPGYDEEPYGPVVQGEQGRYNLKISNEKK